MADISNIQIPNVVTPYDVKDAKAIHSGVTNDVGNNFVLNGKSGDGVERSMTLQFENGNMSGFKNDWNRVETYNLPGVGADIPTINKLMEGKWNIIQLDGYTTDNGAGWVYLPDNVGGSVCVTFKSYSPSPDCWFIPFWSTPRQRWYLMCRNFDGSAVAPNTHITGALYFWA